MQKIMSVVIDVYKIVQEILHNWHFLEIFVNYLQPAQKKLHPDENFLQYAKKPPYFAG
jgi:hypothetical protein